MNSLKLTVAYQGYFENATSKGGSEIEIRQRAYINNHNKYGRHFSSVLVLEEFAWTVE